MASNEVENCLSKWQELGEDYKILEKKHAEYLLKLDEVYELQDWLRKQINHQQYVISSISEHLKNTLKNATSDVEVKDNLHKDILRRQAQLSEMEHVLPHPSELYLRVVLGNVNVSILNKQQKFRYKDEYEKFKISVTTISMVLAAICMITKFRFLELCFMFLLVWYYCTLTIRESILKINGSRIKGWWRAHHFISTALSCILLIWPCGPTYYTFRKQFMIFNLYIAFVQFLQFQYQRGCLYRLKALGERHNMDITIEGFHSWMWRGLSFLFPFLFIGYIFQLYNAYTLFQLSKHTEAKWHEPFLSFGFLILFIGNITTTALVIPQKLKDKVLLKYRFLHSDSQGKNQRHNISLAQKQQ